MGIRELGGEGGRSMIRILYAMTVEQNRDFIYRTVKAKELPDVTFEIIDKVDPEKLMACDDENTIVIARGINYLTLVKNFKHGRVVELAVTGYDIMRGIVECKEKYNARNIAIIISETIRVEKSFLEELLDVSLEVFPVKDFYHLEHVYTFVKQLGFDAILSGFTAFRLAQRDGLNCVRITMGYEAIRLGINEAYSVAMAIIEERKKNELFKIILEHNDNAVIALDRQGFIMAHNEAVYKILNLPQEKVLNGTPITAILPEYKDGNLDDPQDNNEVVSINHRLVVINKKPIVIEGKKQGTVLIIQNVHALQKAEIDIRQKLNKKGLVAKYKFEDIIGSSETIQKTIRIARRYAAASSNVLIIGETGTGKELFAQSIHNSSERRNQPFVAINCAALPEHLLESELFGYVEGAFTGATKGGKVGLFELAHKGTLFLDEIAELPLGLQAKLLRVLQEREIRKLGDDKIIPVDVRIIAATNVDLRLKVKENKFREDLLYRLDVLNLRIPPLRERKSDIKDLAMSFLKSFSANRRSNYELSDEALIELMQYDWPGNIRELQNICERLSVLCENSVITAQDVRETLRLREGAEPAPGQAYDGQRKSQKLTQQQMAEMLGISRTTLWRRTKRQNALKKGEESETMH